MYSPDARRRCQKVAYLVVSMEGKEVHRFKLEKAAVIGRALDANLAIEDPALSRRHCIIEFEEDAWCARDLNSRNGTRLNGHRLTKPHALKEGDFLTLGNALIAFHTGKFIPPRPADPAAALLHESSLAGVTVVARRDPPKKPLPMPKIGRAEFSFQASDGQPLPFTRPPARPIVKPRN